MLEKVDIKSARMTGNKTRESRAKEIMSRRGVKERKRTNDAINSQPRKKKKEWDMDKLKKMQKMELESGGFGKGKIHPLFGEGEERNNEGNNEEKDKANEEKLLHETYEEFVSKLDALLTSLDMHKKEFEATIIRAFEKNPTDEHLKLLSEKYDKLFEIPTSSTTIKYNINKDKSMAETCDQIIRYEKDVMVGEEEFVSQFWNDPTSVAILCDSVDQQCRAYYENGKVKPLDAPSFSLGLTQDFVATELRTPIHATPEVKDNHVDDNVPLSVIMKRLSKGATVRSKSKRNVHVTNTMKSPFINRSVDINRVDTKEEEYVWKYIWCLGRDENEEIFATCNGRSGDRQLFESLEPKTMVVTNIINCLSMVLNHEEADRSPESPNRLFCGISIFSERNMGFKDVEEEQLERMCKNMIVRTVAGGKNLPCLSSIDLMFFPIKAIDHFYLICIELKNPAVIIIDNVDVRKKLKLTKAEKTRDDKHRRDCIVTTTNVVNQYPWF